MDHHHTLELMLGVVDANPLTLIQIFPFTQPFTVTGLLVGIVVGDFVGEKDICSGDDDGLLDGT